MSQLTDLFQGIADAIRGKTGETSAIAAADFATKIAGIPAGGGEVTTVYIPNMCVAVQNNSSNPISARWVAFEVGGYMQSAGKDNCAFIPFLQTSGSTDVAFTDNSAFAAFYATNRGGANATGGGIFRGKSENGVIRGSNKTYWEDTYLYLAHSGANQTFFNISGTLIMW